MYQIAQQYLQSAYSYVASTLSGLSQSVWDTLGPYLTAKPVRAGISKTVRALEFAGACVIFTQFFWYDELEAHSCEVDGYQHDTGKIIFLSAFLTNFSWPYMSYLLDLYNHKGESKHKLIPNIRTIQSIEYRTTDFINSFYTAYHWMIPGLEKRAELGIKIVLYVMIILAPIVDMFSGLGMRFGLKERITRLQHNPNYKKIIEPLIETSFSIVNLSSTATSITAFLINLYYDGSHEEDYPHTNLLLGLFGALAGVIALLIGIKGSDNAQKILAKIQSAVDTLYYADTNTLALISCKNPSAFTPENYAHQGLKMSYATTGAAAFAAMADYLALQPPSDKKAIEQVVFRFADRNWPKAILQSIINYFCLGYLHTDTEETHQLLPTADPTSIQQE